MKLLACLATAANLHAQQSKISALDSWEQAKLDSLAAVLPSLRGLEKIQAKTDIAHFLAPWATDSACAVMESIRPMLSIMPSAHAKLRFYLGYANVYARSSNDDPKTYNRSLAYCDSAIAVFHLIPDREKDSTLLAKTYALCGHSHAKRGNYAQAIPAFLKTMSIYQKIPPRTEHVNLAKRIGEMFYHLGEYAMAMDYYLKALDMARKIRYRWMIRALCNDVGLIYQQMKMPEQALRYYKYALEYIYPEDEKNWAVLEGKSVYLSNLGMTFFEMNRMDSALFYFRKGMELRVKLDRKDLLVRSYVNVGRCYAEMKDYAAARKSFERAFELGALVGDEGVWGRPLLDAGKFFTAFGQPDTAITLLKRGLRLVQKRKERNLEREYYEALSKAYEKLGLHAVAFNYYKRHSALKDSLNEESLQRRIVQTNAMYEVSLHRERADAARLENALNEGRLKIQRWLTIAVASALATMIIAALLLLRARNRLKQINAKLREQNDEILRQKLQIESQAQSLREQSESLSRALNALQELSRFKESMIGMAAHDLKNPLNAMLVVADYIENEQVK
ncbi:MAG: tetratricopeptide repeat protein, partial [Bacteroidia bacterium]|nr:tetratricopeptide repeat protein [Bacteroidia bacterium]